MNPNELNKVAWDSYHDEYFGYLLKDFPDFHENFRNGAVFGLDQYVIDLMGDVKGQKLLDTCCSGDASQAFSWRNLGAKVTACDISEKAIGIAKNNARLIGADDMEFVLTDMQRLEPIGDGQFDAVFATYPVWLSDLQEAMVNWKRVLKPGGRLLLTMEHPFAFCLRTEEDRLYTERNYNFPGGTYYDVFTGTPMADRHGGFSSEKPSMEFFYRVSDVLNAAASAGFRLQKMLETDEGAHNPNLPSDATFLWLAC